VASIEFPNGIPLDVHMACQYTTASGKGSFPINTYPLRPLSTLRAALPRYQETSTSRLSISPSS
jgi:hypothetical protein